MIAKVSVIGVGRLGLSFALLLDSKGYSVIGCDVNEKYIESLDKKTFVSKETGVNEMLSSSNVFFTTNASKALNDSEVIFVFVPTPSKENGEYNHKYVEQVVSKIESHDIRKKTLVIGCTTMPCYTKKLQDKLFNRQIDVVYSPEFIQQGQILEGLKNADMVLVGGENIPLSLFQIYRDIMGKEPNFKTLSHTGAEIAKISVNCFLSMKIAFANLIGEIITNSWEEENVEYVLETIGSDSRVGKKFLSYGFPPGGPCIPRDAKALNHHAYAVGIPTKFTHAIDSENQRHSEFLTRHYTGKNPDKKVPFIFSYLSYKQGVDILTDSYQLKLCIDLLRLGYKVDVPVEIKDIDMPEEFNDYKYNDMVTFGTSPEGGYKIN